MKYVALLRGVSPVNARSAKLQKVFEESGFGNVQTVISSGNVIFSSGEKDVDVLKKRIENELQKQLNLKSAAIVRIFDQVQALVDEHDEIVGHKERQAV